MAPLPPWSDLAPELLELIFKRLDGIDLLRCQGVCVPWCRLSRWFAPPPPLMILTRQEKKGLLFHTSPATDVILYSPDSGRRASLPFPMENSVCRSATPDGWLVVVSVDKPHLIHLLHPISFAKIGPLPPLVCTGFDGKEITDYSIPRDLRIFTSTPNLLDDPRCIFFAYLEVPGSSNGSLQTLGFYLRCRDRLAYCTLQDDPPLWKFMDLDPVISYQTFCFWKDHFHSTRIRPYGIPDDHVFGPDCNTLDARLLRCTNGEMLRVCRRVADVVNPSKRMICTVFKFLHPPHRVRELGGRSHLYTACHLRSQMLKEDGLQQCDWASRLF